MKKPIRFWFYTIIIEARRKLSIFENKLIWERNGMETYREKRTHSKNKLMYSEVVASYEAQTKWRPLGLSETGCTINSQKYSPEFTYAWIVEVQQVEYKSCSTNSSWYLMVILYPNLSVLKVKKFINYTNDLIYRHMWITLCKCLILINFT